MSEQKKGPADNGTPQEEQPKETLLDLADEYFECWRPALTIKSSEFLGKRLSITQAQVTALVRDNEILRASNINLHERVLHLELGYSQLCKAWDENKALHHEIGVRQKNHVQTCHRNFTKIAEELKRRGI